MLEGSILQKLQNAHQDSPQPLKFGVYYKNTLVSLCHALEDYVLHDLSQPLIISAFQQGKWYLQEADRYQTMATRSRHIAIMARPDAGFTEHATGQQANVSLVNLQAGDPVAQEWHLIILAPTYTAMVLCQELSEQDYGPAGKPEQDLERKFYGFWTFEPALVQETIDLAIAHIGQYDTSLQQQLQTYREQIERSPACFEDLNTVVARIVDYLRTGQQELELQRRSNAAPLFRYRALDRNLMSNEVQAFLRMAELLDQTDQANPYASAEVATLCEAMGQLLDLPAWQVRRLRLAALLHRLDPIQSMAVPITVIKDAVESESAHLSCPILPGVQILRKMPQLRAIAQIITHQTERWNGQGEPAGLQGDAIPLESRILGLLIQFQQDVTQAASQGKAMSEALIHGLEQCQTAASNAWDPKLVDALVLLVNGLMTGWELPFSETKVTAGLWLLDQELAEQSTSQVSGSGQPAQSMVS